MSEIFNDLQEAPGIGFPVRLQDKTAQITCYRIYRYGSYWDSSATANKVRTPVAGRENVYSSPRSELTALIRGTGASSARVTRIDNSLTRKSPHTGAGGRESASSNLRRWEAHNHCREFFAVGCSVGSAAQTGADIELPPGRFQPAHLGTAWPRTARSVLATLLDSTNLTTLSGPLRPIRKASKAYY